MELVGKAAPHSTKPSQSADRWEVTTSPMPARVMFTLSPSPRIKAHCAVVRCRGDERLGSAACSL